MEDSDATGAAAGVATVAVERKTAIFAGKTGGRPGGLASERLEREPDNKYALEIKVPNNTLRLRRDALALQNRFVQAADEGLTTERREFGAGVCTITSPLGFVGTAYISEVTCEKTAPETTKATLFGKLPMKL